MQLPVHPPVTAELPNALPFRSIRVFSTSPQSVGAEPESYLKQVQDVARWSEDAGCTGILVYTDNSVVDPWLVSQIIVRTTNSLVPLVAVQPVYMHPYTVAKMIASFGFLHARRLALNMVAGGFANDLAALHDQTPHDLRYKRLFEYARIIQLLTSSNIPVTFHGPYYQVTNLVLKPAVPTALQPEFFVSGSSPAGMQAARDLNATAVNYPGPPGEPLSDVLKNVESSGIRIGVIARSRHDSAWSAAGERFPADRRGQLTQALAMKVSDSAWHKRLSSLAHEKERSETYWLGPFQISKSNCPYLVGDYDEVAEELFRYIGGGYRTFILDIPPCEDELHHISIAFQRAVAHLQDAA